MTTSNAIWSFLVFLGWFFVDVLDVLGLGLEQTAAILHIELGY